MEQPTQTELLRIYEVSWGSRYLDEALQHWYHKNTRDQSAKIKKPQYSAVGNELGPSAISTFLKDEDFLIPRYRGYAAILGKGLGAEHIVAEVMGKHYGAAERINDVTPFKNRRHNIVGNSLVLGSNFPVAIGLAFAKKFKNEPDIVVQFFGDGESSRSTFGNALNLAKLWQLPILFVCENNGVSMHTNLHEMSATETVAERAKGYNIPYETLHQTEPLKLIGGAKEIVARVRKERQPFLFEIIGKRFSSQSSFYDTEPFLSSMLRKDEDSLLLFEKELLELNISKSDLQVIQTSAKQLIDDTIGEAERSSTLTPGGFLEIYYEQ